MISSSLQSLTSYTNNLLTGSQNTQEIAGVRVNTETGAIVEETNWKDDAVSLSPEARAALERIDNLTSHLNTIQTQLGGRQLTQGEITQISEITAKLDDIYDVETVPPSEAYLYMTEENRAAGAEIITELSSIYEGIPDGVEPTDEQQAEMNRLTAELDVLLDQSRVRSSHNIADLPADIQEDVIAQFKVLAELVSGGGSLSASETERAAVIAQNIDNAFTEYGTEKPARELSAAEKSEAEKLLNELAELFEQAEANSMSSFLLESRAQTTSLFLSILNGEDQGSNRNDLGSLLTDIQNGSSSSIASLL
ncbi:MAG: hypothetical protein VX730_03140 [Pseudomonadota bacterium]|nr:hypothetical protein [Pseudomonadota bacterium]